MKAYLNLLDIDTWIISNNRKVKTQVKDLYTFGILFIIIKMIYKKNKLI